MSTTGAKYPTLGATVSESPWSDDTWVGPTNIYSDNATYASVTGTTFDAGDQTYVLKATGFDFSGVPSDAIIDGVICKVNAYMAVAASIDLAQLLDTSKAKVGTNLAATPITMSTDIATIHTIGGSTNLWGNALTAAWVKNSSFGVAIGCLAGGTGNNNVDVFVDYVTLEVYWHRTLTADKATFTLTANNAGLVVSRKLAADKATFTLTTYGAGFSKLRILAATQASFILTAWAAILKVSRELDADKSTFTLTAWPAILKVSRKLPTEVAAFTLTAWPAILKTSRKLVADTSSFVLTSWPAALKVSRKLTIEAASFILTFWDAILTYTGGGIITTKGRAHMRAAWAGAMLKWDDDKKRRRRRRQW